MELARAGDHPGQRSGTTLTPTPTKRQMTFEETGSPSGSAPSPQGLLLGWPELAGSAHVHRAGPRRAPPLAAGCRHRVRAFSCSVHDSWRNDAARQACLLIKQMGDGLASRRERCRGVDASSPPRETSPGCWGSPWSSTHSLQSGLQHPRHGAGERACPVWPARCPLLSGGRCPVPVPWVALDSAWWLLSSCLCHCPAPSRGPSRAEGGGCSVSAGFWKHLPCPR